MLYSSLVLRKSETFSWNQIVHELHTTYEKILQYAFFEHVHLLPFERFLPK